MTEDELKPPKGHVVGTLSDLGVTSQGIMHRGRALAQAMMMMPDPPWLHPLGSLIEDCVASQIIFMQSVKHVKSQLEKAGNPPATVNDLLESMDKMVQMIMEDYNESPEHRDLEKVQELMTEGKTEEVMEIVRARLEKAMREYKKSKGTSADPPSSGPGVA